ncbi:DE-cadherin-like [Odontomachus brunneus]|uniref:DE-cadherin-like n=1 Tax=Odontomachus brunneus TaxID=486640 RepID=UPI0013F1EA99|nr:DE-cadherin-like [Odontomachus brunneus]XP_032690317.1 DE-cadherin-like [Odontomachus brunneus]XP_032690318.1 DE-cadherin-like [Odontomachus brunneus]
MGKYAAGARPRLLLGLPFLACVLLYGTLATARRLKNSICYFSDRDELFIHNHRPVFTNCAKYAPLVEEGAQIGTYVFQVHAEDPDPPENGGTVTYKFLSPPPERLKFKINNITGEITTTEYMDRDEPFREREFYLTVLATDNGKPELHNICRFKVTITDINDNEPIFDKVTYTESVPQDLPVNHKVMRVSAVDLDAGENATIHYSLGSKTIDNLRYFRIDRWSGVIYLKRPIDRDPGYKFNLIAIATDLGTPTLITHVDLEIRVVEPYKEAPTFLSWPTAPIELFENFSDFDASIVRLKAVSNVNDSNNSENSYLHFELVTGTTEQTNKENTFRLESNNDVADIKLSEHLDFERNRMYSLIIRVQNKNELAAEIVVKIEVLEVKDDIPLFNIEKRSIMDN